MARNLSSRSRCIPIALLAAGLFFGTAQDSTALTYIVSNKLDAGAGSLRQAILAANSSPGEDIITFDITPGSPFADGVPDTILLSTGQLSISDDVKIEGPSSAKVTLDAAYNSRIFNVDDANPSRLVAVSIATLELTRGQVDGLLVGGGAIFNREALTLTHCTVRDSKVGILATGGAGIRNNQGQLTIIDSTIMNNASSAPIDDGGGILNDGGGALTVTDSRISGNTAVQVGGGVYNREGTVNIERSTIENNEASTNAKGGGLANWLGHMEVRESLIRGNRAFDLTQASVQGAGGAIWNQDTMVVVSSSIEGNSIGAGRGEVVLAGGIANFGEMTLLGSTVAENIAYDADPLHYGEGYYGGIVNLGTLSLINSTVSSNRAENGVGGIGNAGSLTVANSTVSHNVDQSLVIGVGEYTTAAALPSRIPLSPTARARTSIAREARSIVEALISLRTAVSPG